MIDKLEEVERRFERLTADLSNPEVLADSAKREGISLNQYIVGLLSRHDTQARLERQLAAVEDQLKVLQERFEPHSVE